jgi:hypothetical protein
MILSCRKFLVRLRDSKRSHKLIFGENQFTPLSMRRKRKNLQNRE